MHLQQPLFCPCVCLLLHLFASSYSPLRFRFAFAVEELDGTRYLRAPFPEIMWGVFSSACIV